MIARFMSQVLLWIIILIFVILIDIISKNATAELTNEIQDMKITRCDENYNYVKYLLWLLGFGLGFFIMMGLILLVYYLINSQCANCICDLVSRLTPNFHRSRQEPQERVIYRRPRVELGISTHQNTRTTIQRNNEM